MSAELRTRRCVAIGAGVLGVYVAVTHSGVTLAAHLARLITAELITGAPPAALAPCRPGRFTAAS